MSASRKNFRALKWFAIAVLVVGGPIMLLRTDFVQHRIERAFYSFDPPDYPVAKAPECYCDAPSAKHVSASLAELETDGAHDDVCPDNAYIRCSSWVSASGHVEAHVFDIYTTPGKAVDGETMVLDGATYRLWGITAPHEGEAYFEQAKQALDFAAIDAGHLGCYDKGMDADGYTLLRCLSIKVRGEHDIILHDLAAEMAGHGYATDNADESDGYYSVLEERARKEHRGMWENTPGIHG